MQSQDEQYEVRPEDLTILIAIRAGEDQQGMVRRHIHAAQLSTLEYFASRGVKILRIDYGSNPPLDAPPPWITPVVIETDEPWNEPKAKNIGLKLVQTPYTAISNADVLFPPGVLDRTLNALRLNGFPKHFILQGIRWEMPRLLTDMAYSELMKEGGVDHSLKMAENLSIPASIPRLATAEWQVFRTEDALAIGGMDERMNGYGASDSDFHDRMRLYIMAKFKNLNCEIICRTIPILHGFHYGERPRSPHHDLRKQNILKFIQSGKVEDLRW